MIVKSKSERGFWRAGIHFTREGVEIDPATLDAGQLAAIRAEPALIITDDTPEADDKPTKAKAKNKP